MTQPFTRADLARAEHHLLRDGRFANARVERVRLDAAALVADQDGAEALFSL